MATGNAEGPVKMDDANCGLVAKVWPLDHRTARTGTRAPSFSPLCDGRHVVPSRRLSFFPLKVGIILISTSWSGSEDEMK